MNKPLTEVCNITTGKLDANAATINGAYPFFTCAPDPLRIDNYAFDDDAILLAGNNAQGNFHINRYCGKFNAYQRTYVITAKDGYDIDYIKYSIELSLEHLKKVSQGSQTKFLTIQILNSFKVSDIPYTSQQKLIKSIKKIDQKIELNNRIIAELEAMSKTIYDYWFVQFDFPNVEGKPYRSAGGEMVWNEQLKREIPKGWEAKSVISTFDVCYGYPFDTNQFVDFPNEKPVVRIRDILNCDVSAYTTESVDVKYWLQEKDLVIGMDGNFHMNFWSSTPALLNQRCVRIRGNEEYSALQAYFASLPYIKAREKNVTRTTVGHLSADDINSLYILTPDLPLQKKITEMFDSFLEKMCKTKKENIELAKLRDWLLPMLMNGQVTVE